MKVCAATPILLAFLITRATAQPLSPAAMHRHMSPLRPQLRLFDGLQHRFVPSLQVPAVAVSASNEQINAVTDLGANNPSKQCSPDGTSCNYH